MEATRVSRRDRGVFQPCAGAAQRFKDPGSSDSRIEDRAGITAVAEGGMLNLNGNPGLGDNPGTLSLKHALKGGR
jgi:hypothetical protein